MSFNKRFSSANWVNIYWSAALTALVTLGGVLPVTEAEAFARNPEDLLIVDCLLPGQMRKLGRVSTFMSARRPIRTTQSDCEIRGGEYVSYDRANYQTALNVWMAQAQAGDAEAQNYVGEIYAKGLGIEPDYAKAREWFDKAAALGFKRAMTNLGYLLEEGLGGEKDVAKALNLYRQASGVTDDELVFASSVTISADAEAQIEQLQQTVESQQEQIRALQSELDANRRNYERAQSSLDSTRKQLEEKKRVLGLTPDRDPGRVDLALAAREAELDSERLQLETDKKNFATAVLSNQTRMAELKQQESGLAAQIKAAPTGSAQSASASAELKKVRAAASELALTLESVSNQSNALEAKLSLNQKLLLSERAKFAAERRAMEGKLNASKQDRELLFLLERQLAEKQRELSGQRDRITSLEQQIQIGSRSGGGGNIAARTGLAVEMIDPPITLTRGRPAAMASRIGTTEIVGQVRSKAPVQKVLINNVPISVAANGIFRANVPVAKQGSTIRIVAESAQGEQSKSLEFLLVPAPNAKPVTTNVVPTIRKWPSSAKLGRQFALVIGNNNYSAYPKLESAVADSQAVANVLTKRYGFKTTLLNNANRFEILSALNTLRESLTAQDNLLVYYAGHGELDRNTDSGYWVPTDGRNNAPNTWISNRAISDILNTMSAKHALVIADSCYSGAMTRASVPAISSAASGAQWELWVKQMSASRSRTAFTSGGLAPVPDSGAGGNSTFARALINALNDNTQLLEAQRLYRDVTASMAIAASKSSFAQIPEYAPIKFAGHEAGEFFFLPTKA